jgi:hypothetical protein
MTTTAPTTARTTIRRSSAALVLAAAVAAPVLAAGPAQAQGGSPGVRASGACTGGGVWKLKAKHDNGRVQVEYEVDTNRVGQPWKVTITDNNATIFSGTRTTVAPSGSFTVRVLTGDRAGADVIRTKATFGTHTCLGAVRV